MAVINRERKRPKFHGSDFLDYVIAITRKSGDTIVALYCYKLTLLTFAKFIIFHKMRASPTGMYVVDQICAFVRLFGKAGISL